MRAGGSIVNTASVTAYRSNPKLIDYSATKGAITTFTRSLAGSLAERGIRVNGVAPGPIWTPLIPASFDAEKVKSFGKDTPMKRAGQPSEVAPCYVFLCSEDASYMTGKPCIRTVEASSRPDASPRSWPGRRQERRRPCTHER